MFTANRKGVYYETFKRKRPYVDPSQKAKSTARPNRFRNKAIPVSLKPVWCYLDWAFETRCNWWWPCYQKQLAGLICAVPQRHPEYQQIQHDSFSLVIMPWPTKWSWVANWLYLKTGNLLLMQFAHKSWHRLITTYSTMGHALSEKHFSSFNNVIKWIDDCLKAKPGNSFGAASTNCHKDENHVVLSDSNYFEE